MGKSAREIIDLDASALINTLNKALADEWFAYYQYWIGAQLVTGTMKELVINELNQHATDELRHAQLLVERIVQLNGVPILDPNEWREVSNCQYLKPTNFHQRAIIQQGLAGERCAIKTYSNMLKMLRDKDEITYQLILTILKDELDHEEDFESLLEDMSTKTG